MRSGDYHGYSQLVSRSATQLVSQRGGFLKSFILLALFVFFSDLQAQGRTDSKVSSSDKLKQAKELALQTLDRINNGIPPCQSPGCAERKSETLFKLQDEIQKMKWSLQKDLSVSPGFWLARNPRPALNHDPKNLKEWLAWWKQRHSSRLTNDAEWMGAYETIVSMEKSFQSLIDLPNLDPFAWDRLKAKWNRRFREAIVNFFESIDLENQGQRAEDQGRLGDAKRLRQEAEKNRQEYGKYEKASGRSLVAQLREIFPDMNSGESLRVMIQMNHLMNLYGTEDLEDEEFYKFLEACHQNWRSSFRAAQVFADLEYGVIGLANFDSAVNPAVAYAKELEIQKTLDKVEVIGTQLLDYGPYAFTLAGVREFALGSKLVSLFALFVTSYMVEKYDLKVGQKILPPSERTQQILSQLDGLEDKMSRRKESLIQAKKVLEKRIEEIDRRLEKN